MSDMIGHGVYATGCDAQMQIQVAESFLPVQSSPEV